MTPKPGRFCVDRMQQQVITEPMHADNIYWIYWPVFAPCLVVKGKNRPSVRQIEHTSASGLIHSYPQLPLKVKQLKNGQSAQTDACRTPDHPRRSAKVAGPNYQSKDDAANTLEIQAPVFWTNIVPCHQNRGHPILCWYCSAFPVLKMGAALTTCIELFG